MVSSFTTAGTKALGGARFALVNLFPATILSAYITFLLTTGAYLGAEISLTNFVPDKQFLTVLLICVFVFSVLLHPFQVLMVQVLEGYWYWPTLRGAADLATERHRRRLDTARMLDAELSSDQPETTDLEEAVRMQRTTYRINRRLQRSFESYLQYPQPREGDDRLMPTMLGNVLRNAEDVAGSRYGLDAMTVYPRIYPYLSQKLDKAISQQLDLISTTCSLCYVFAIGAMLSLPLIPRIDAWTSAPVIAIALAVLSYRGAVRLAEHHGQLLATVFDLHRFDMLKGLHYPLPKTARSEVSFNRRLTEFLQTGQLVTDSQLAWVTYEHSSFANQSDTTADPSNIKEK